MVVFQRPVAGVLGILTVLLLAACSASPQPAATTTATSSPSPTGPARIVATEELADRQVDLTVDSPAVGAEVKVRLLLPKGYQDGDNKRRPVLYLLHGCCDTYVSWTRSTDIAELSADDDLLVVMPRRRTGRFLQRLADRTGLGAVPPHRAAGAAGRGLRRW